MTRKNISMNPPLERLYEEYGGGKGRDGKFSRRLGDIVERFDLIMELTITPKISEIENMILSEIICGSVLTPVKIKYMHEDVLYSSVGTQEDREEFAMKVATWNAAERIAVIETLGV